MSKNKTQRLVTIAFFITFEILLTRFCSIQTDIVRISFGFLPIAMVAILYGPIWSGCAYAAGDILGMLIFPTGPYFPGFTVTAFLTGCIFGIFLYEKNPLTFKNILPPVLIVCLIINLFLDTLWLNILYGQGYLIMLPLRMIKCAIMIPVQIILIKLVWNKCLVKLNFIHG